MKGHWCEGLVFISQSVLGCGGKGRNREKERKIELGSQICFQVGGGEIFIFFFWSEIFSASEASSAAPAMKIFQNIFSLKIFQHSINNIVEVLSSLMLV